MSQTSPTPEIMEGRVKTIHPKIAGGILAKRDSHAEVAKEHGLVIDIVVVNLYPFAATIAKPDVTLDEAVETDIGGPGMIRAAAKNYHWVTVITDPTDYEPVLDALQNGDTTLEQRKKLAIKTFAHTAEYDSQIAGYLADEHFPETLAIGVNKKADLRYGKPPSTSRRLYQWQSGHCPSGTIARQATIL